MQLEGFVAIYTEYYILAMECLAETSLTGEAFQLQIDFESQLVNSCGFISFHIAASQWSAVCDQLDRLKEPASCRSLEPGQISVFHLDVV